MMFVWIKSSSPWCRTIHTTLGREVDDGGNFMPLNMHGNQFVVSYIPMGKSVYQPRGQALETPQIAGIGPFVQVYERISAGREPRPH
jgi:hypothetical protein